MITKEKIEDELYVFIYVRGKKELLYKRWLKLGYGMVMVDRQPFTAGMVDSLKKELEGNAFDLHAFVRNELFG